MDLPSHLPFVMPSARTTRASSNRPRNEINGAESISTSFHCVERVVDLKLGFNVVLALCLGTEQSFRTTTPNRETGISKQFGKILFRFEEKKLKLIAFDIDIPFRGDRTSLKHKWVLFQVLKKTYRGGVVYNVDFSNGFEVFDDRPTPEQMSDAWNMISRLHSNDTDEEEYV